MFPTPIDQIPLSTEAIALRDQILAIPRTESPLRDESNAEDTDDILDMHDLASRSPRRAIPELKKRIKRNPACKPYWNYLYRSYRTLGMDRQANATLKEMTQTHPNYLFGLISRAEDAFYENRLEQAAAYLGPDLDIRSLYPEREIFHVSELSGFYFLVARILAKRGEIELARGIKEALQLVLYSKEMQELLEREITLAAVMALTKKITVIAEQKIEVKTAPLTLPNVKNEPPAFHHTAVKMLYQSTWILYDNEITGLMALPHDTLILDLMAVIRDCTLRGPFFLKNAKKQDAQNAAYHAIHLLAELGATCEVQDILAFFSVHPDVLEFCYITEFRPYRQIARLIAHDLPTCFTWLRSPGIHHRGKAQIISAMEWLATTEPERLSYIQSELGAVLAFLLDSPREDNVLDSVFTGDLCVALKFLRSKEHLPLIRKAYEMKLLNDFFYGTIEDMEQSMFEPMQAAEPWLNIYEQYEHNEIIDEEGYEEEYDEEEEMDYDDADDLEDPMHHVLSFPQRMPPNPLLSQLMPSKQPALPAFTPPESRNAPCPCGSGKKYKKCCAPQ